ncbi:hypothetical protein [Novosphingobium sp. 9]|uniref:hypothetical protein n=1 Tax=Novosphingobium sp. 9 TaxID=2025349 RepID=UPI0021B68005|nr:hypothetical protein [Novosphingobium sp. 9]
MVRVLSMAAALASASTIFTGVGASAPATHQSQASTTPATGSADRPFVLSKVNVTATPLPN